MEENKRDKVDKERKYKEENKKNVEGGQEEVRRV